MRLKGGVPLVLLLTACSPGETEEPADPDTDSGDVLPEVPAYQCDFDAHDGRVAGVVQVDAEGAQGGISGIPVSIDQDGQRRLIYAGSDGTFDEADLEPGRVSVWPGRTPGTATWTAPDELPQESTTCTSILATTCALEEMVFTTHEHCLHND